MSDNNSGTEIASLAVAVVALLVAIIAFIGTTAQVLQQYMATAELRFEVVFRSPEISVEYWDLDQIHHKFDKGMEDWDLPEPQPEDDLTVNETAQTTTVADYSASWLALLSTLRDMENKSAHFWDLRSAKDCHCLGGYTGPPLLSSIIVKVQAKIQTLDLMPEGVKKPYATATLSTIIHLAAILGLYLKEFDRRNDRYVANGNGLLITGSAVPHLGTMFLFTRHGNPDF
ncbi:hypothetical protein N658DRAFT_557296 [Parathielavia hyrcaniae]|uniref:Uncharacterized protein n=1 Tax=Parathielavia hyrcaniae TaxID=113614 RepID=A0AAN6Q4L6_9PEZI|nr:hypothetical protein N658DRAFT_557296 [Parathielavia hyrcaniae]